MRFNRPSHKIPDRLPRCRAPACAVAALSPSDRSVAPGVHRRDLDQDQYGAAARLGATRREAEGQGAASAMEDHDFPRRAAARSCRGAMADRRSDQWRTLPALRREGAAADTASRRPRRHRQSRQPPRQGIRSVGAKLFFLPKYSPDLNPIEQLFAKLKHWLRNAAGRSVDAVSNAIGHILGTVTTNECANYFANAGYKPA